MILPAASYHQHNRQLDPTEIVLIPYDISRLWLHVAMVTFFYITTSSKTLLRKQIPILLSMTACTTAAYIIYGASPTDNKWQTLAAALYLVILVQWDSPAWILERDAPSSSLSVLERLSLAASNSRAAVTTSAVDRLAIVQTQAVVGFTIVLHILRLYDRGWQLQRWPVPTILGATVGWIAGRWMGLLTLQTSERQTSSHKGDL